MKQNGVVCYQIPALLFFIYIYIKSYRDFRETGSSSHSLYLANLFSLQGSTTNS